MEAMDWGQASWDVDKKADSLNKSLFGNKKAKKVHEVKADLNISDQNGTTLGADSDDDENLSRKAKKKLKERKRKENKRTKRLNDESTENDGQESNVEKKQVDKSETKKLKIKAQKVKVQASEPLTGKPKGKASSTDKADMKPTATKEQKISSGKVESEDKEKVGKKGKKRKISVSEEGNEKKAKVENPDVNADEQPTKQIQRKKKKKPNSDKNKYKHLGLKSQAEKQAMLDSDVEFEAENIQGSKKAKGVTAVAAKVVTAVAAKVAVTKPSVPVNEVKPKKSNSRKKKSTSAENEDEPAKKVKVVEKPVEAKLSRKQKREMKIEEKKLNDGKKNTNGLGDSVKVEKSKKKKEAQVVASGDEPQTQEKKGKAKNSRKKNKPDTAAESEEENSNDSSPEEEAKSSPFFSSSSKGSELLQKMTGKLASARFRFINEQLYTIQGGEAFRMFQQDKTLMDAYHTGFQGQVKHWSVNPLDVIIKQLSTKPGNLVVADFGCGEAKLSASVPQKVHSFDLYALNKRVTVCDMAKTPLPSGSVDIAVFCLSLMGTNLNDYVLEANRILKDGGLLKIAEVASRFTVPNVFIKSVSSLGFKAVNTRELSTMFYLLDFKKVKKMEKSSRASRPVSLKPCLYKKR